MEIEVEEISVEEQEAEAEVKIIRHIGEIKPKVKTPIKVMSKDERQKETIEAIIITEVTSAIEIQMRLVPQIPEKWKITETGA